MLLGDADLQQLNENSLERRGKPGEHEDGRNDNTFRNQSRSTSSTASKRKLNEAEPESQADPKQSKT